MNNFKTGDIVRAKHDVEAFRSGILLIKKGEIGRVRANEMSEFTGGIIFKDRYFKAERFELVENPTPLEKLLCE